MRRGGQIRKFLAKRDRPRMTTSPLVRKCGKLNEGLPPAGQSSSDALARNKHQILVHTLLTILHRCMRRGVVTKKKWPGLFVRCEKHPETALSKQSNTQSKSKSK